MHICHLILTHSFAGSERYAIELANEQSKSHKVTLILHRRGCEDRANALLQRVSTAVTVHQVNGPKWWASFQAKRLIKKIKPDVAHAHLSAGCKALKGVSSCWRVATLHIRYKASQHAHLDQLIAIAPWQLEAIPSSLCARSVQIDNWTQAKKADPEARKVIRKKWGVNDDEFVIGALGRIEPTKGHEILLDAFKDLNHKKTKLVVVGDGSALEELRLAAPENVIFTGFSMHPEKCYAGFDGFVSAAESEPFGLVFLEAMTAGLPMVATASQGALYLKEYFIVPPVPLKDKQGLKEALQSLSAQPKIRTEYSMQRFNIGARVSDITASYKKHLFQ